MKKSLKVLPEIHEAFEETFTHWAESDEALGQNLEALRLTPEALWLIHGTVRQTHEALGQKVTDFPQSQHGLQQATKALRQTLRRLAQFALIPQRCLRL